MDGMAFLLWHMHAKAPRPVATAECRRHLPGINRARGGQGLQAAVNTNLVRDVLLRRALYSFAVFLFCRFNLIMQADASDALGDSSSQCEHGIFSNSPGFCPAAGCPAFDFFHDALGGKPAV